VPLVADAEAGIDSTPQEGVPAPRSGHRNIHDSALLKVLPRDLFKRLRRPVETAGVFGNYGSNLPITRLCRSVAKHSTAVEACDDGGDVDKEVAPGVRAVVGRVDVEDKNCGGMGRDRSKPWFVVGWSVGSQPRSSLRIRASWMRI
jgi:hypothetical protein